MFAGLWLIENLSALSNAAPTRPFVYDLPSMVHVLDLAFVLPLVIGSGLLLLRAHPAGAPLAAVMLVKMVTLGLALLFMNGGTAVAGSTFDPAETAMWATIVVIGAALLALLLRSMGAPPNRWLKPSIWGTG
jgi:hypothetical protein